MGNADKSAAIYDTNGVGLSSSALSRFKCYGEYEKCDLALSCITIETLVSPTPRDSSTILTPSRIWRFPTSDLF